MSLHFTPYVEINGHPKPANAGKKKSKHQKRRQIEPELFAEKSLSVSPVKLMKKKDDWKVLGNHGTNKDDDLILDPDRATVNPFLLVRRNDYDNCPKKVKRCEACKILFTTDIVVIKTSGEREFTDKKGKKNHQHGNVYIHYLTKCIRQYDPMFTFSQLVVPESTQDGLSNGNIQELKRKGCKLL